MEGSAHVQSFGGVCHHAVTFIQRLTNQRAFQIVQMFFQIEPFLGQSTDAGQIGSIRETGLAQL
jgi:hypothetical protein